jgi:hypothetical protein
LDEAAVDLVARPDEVVVLRHFDDHSLWERLRAAVRSVIAKAAAAEGSRPLRHVIAHDRLYPLLPFGPDGGIIFRRLLQFLLGNGLGGQHHAAGAHVDALSVTEGVHLLDDVVHGHAGDCR